MIKNLQLSKGTTLSGGTFKWEVECVGFANSFQGQAKRIRPVQRGWEKGQGRRMWTTGTYGVVLGNVTAQQKKQRNYRHDKKKMKRKTVPEKKNQSGEAMARGEHY